MLLLSLVAVCAADPTPVRIASGVSGHIHPAACVTKSGAVLVIFGQSDMKDLRLTRSADGGKTWTEPVPFEPSAKDSIYPGSLTTLADGRVVHAWNMWYPEPTVKGGKSRFVRYAVSEDEGKTWGPSVDLPKPAKPELHSVVRHPFVELSPTEWLVTAQDKTVVHDPKTGKEAPFADGKVHGLVPIVRTPKGTLVSGAGLRSEDGGKTWAEVKPFPKIGADGWRFDLTVLSNGWLVAGEVQGPGFGGDRWRWVVSRDDGKTWDFDAGVMYDPGRPIGGRACPKTVQLDKDTVGTVFYDTDAKQDGGAGVFFLRTPVSKFGGK